MRALFAGETVSHDGLVRVDRAKLHTLPAQPPPLIGPAVSVETAGWAGEWADGLATVNQPRAKLEEMIAAFRSNGGEGKRLVLQVHLSWAPSEEEALRVAHEQWRTNVFPPPTCWDVETAEDFDRLAEDVTPEQVRETVLVSSDLAPPHGVAPGAGGAGLRRDQPAPRRPGPDRVHRRLRRARAARAWTA